MIVDDIKTIVQANSWIFLYGDKATQNLMDGEISTDTNLFLFPVESTGTLTEMNKPEVTNWNISMIICRKSDMDAGSQAENGTDQYYEKWLANIKPLYAEIMDEFLTSFACLSQYTITSQNTSEIINSMDWNVDGLLVRLTIREDMI